MSPAQVRARQEVVRALGRVMRDRNVQLRISEGQRRAIIRDAVSKVEERKKRAQAGRLRSGPTPRASSTALVIRLSSEGHRCAYVLSVSDTFLWPRNDATAFGEHPDEISNDTA